MLSDERWQVVYTINVNVESVLDINFLKAVNKESYIVKSKLNGLIDHAPVLRQISYLVSSIMWSSINC